MKAAFATTVNLVTQLSRGSRELFLLVEKVQNWDRSPRKNIVSQRKQPCIQWNPALQPPRLNAVAFLLRQNFFGPFMNGVPLYFFSPVYFFSCQDQLGSQFAYSSFETTYLILITLQLVNFTHYRLIRRTLVIKIHHNIIIYFFSPDEGSIAKKFHCHSVLLKITGI